MENGIKDTVLKMNLWGEQGRPFFFMFNFNLDSAVILPLDQLREEDVLLNTPRYSNEKDSQDSRIITFRKSPISYERYALAYGKVFESIQRGDTFLLNLTFPTEIESNLDLNQIFQLTRAPYRMKYKDRFVVFSPEPFVRMDKGRINTHPMKGTRDADEPEAEKSLIHDPKEIAEHNTIVDLLRNDLNMVSKQVRVEKFRYIEKISTHERTLLQTSSMISGVLPEDWKSRLGTIIKRLLPAGSISGAPKEKTLEIIRAAEGYDRGWFTGVFGIFDGEVLDSAVMIRYIEQEAGRLIFKSGGGITCFSDCEGEYRELVKKVALPV
jgi:para-aminobenzoate synthetase component 1